MRETNHLYKKILNTAPFGTLFFAYGVRIDANQKALSILGCDRTELVGLSLNDSNDSQPPLLLQLKKVIAKIDREFIANLNSDKDTLGLVEVIMMVSRHYGLDVVAEGVEKREVLEVLRSLGCDKYQGAHLSMPVSLDRFQKLLVA
jgi:predicted signal transduction protein with EAL and GGDEF domain